VRGRKIAMRAEEREKGVGILCIRRFCCKPCCTLDARFVAQSTSQGDEILLTVRRMDPESRSLLRAIEYANLVAAVDD
jgi:hypothetical protein